MTFIPANGPATDDLIVANDGWYPDISVAVMKAETGLVDVFGPARIAAVLAAAMIEVNASISAWRAARPEASLDDVPAMSYGDISEKVLLYRTAVTCRARAELLASTRDYDSTKSGHARADALEATADDWQRRSIEALARLTGRPRTTVDLI